MRIRIRQPTAANGAVICCSRAASTSTSSKRPVFPPPGLARVPKKLKDAAAPPGLQPEIWLALQLPTESATSAFAHRIGLASLLSSPQELQEICIHPTYVPFFAHYNQSSKPLRSNGVTSVLGNSLLGLFATEHLHAAYPHLPTRVLKAAVTAFVGPTTCATITRQMGAAPLLRWKRTTATLTRPAVLLDDALASIPRSIIGLLYRKQSIAEARRFFQDFFLSRELDLRSLMKFKDPKLSLSETVKYFNREPPKSRLLKETGRLSASPMFVVGIYSGVDRLGEGFGSSLKMAEYRAAEDSLHRLYLTKQPLEPSQLPSSTLGLSGQGIFSHGSQFHDGVKYTPSALGHPETLLDSAGRSGALAEFMDGGVASSARMRQEDLL